MYAKFFKRVIDFLLSLMAICILFPVLLILVIITAIAMRGNPFFIQMRPGRIDNKTGKEKIFKIIKFRTMSYAKDENGKLLSDGERLNKYGQFLRSTSLDELPELFNILRGDMSIVGPRPQLVCDMVFMTPEQRERHKVRPGLTGYAQISGRNNITWEQKIEHDIEYVNSGVTFANDVRIILKTFGKVIGRNDTVREGTASDLDFGDWLLREGKIDQATYEAKKAEAEEISRTCRCK